MINKATVKYIQSLQDKKFRDEHNMFIAEGPKLVAELLKDKIFECEDIFCTETGAGLISSLFGDIEPGTINIIEDFELEKISALTVPNHILGVFQKKAPADAPDFKEGLTLVLDDIQDPGNLGTMIRIADWFGVKQMLCSPATADCYNPKVVQSTMASLGRVNIIYGDIRATLAANPGIRKYAALLGGKDVRTFGRISEGFIIIGNESKGISPALQELAEESISIAGYGGAESLNAAVAAGIILFSVRG
ncbi:MAG: RNA methyltransferase [Ferruginibacter sp.]